MLAAAVGARSVVEVGTGAGVSGLCLLAGMRPDGVLTTVDIESDNQRAAKTAFTEAGIAANRYRLINGSAAEVLPRLTDGAYDLVYVDADKTGYGVYHEQALRLLRPGGVVAYDNMLWHDRVADPSVRDSETVDAARARPHGSRRQAPRQRAALGRGRAAGRRQALTPCLATYVDAAAQLPDAGLRFTEFCHLLADTRDELHEMADAARRAAALLPGPPVALALRPARRTCAPRPSGWARSS